MEIDKETKRFESKGKKPVSNVTPCAKPDIHMPLPAAHLPIEMESLLPPSDVTFPQIVACYRNAEDKSSFLRVLAGYEKKLQIAQGIDVFTSVVNFRKLAETLLLFHELLTAALEGEAQARNERAAYQHYIINTDGAIPLWEGQDSFDVFAWTTEYAGRFNIELEEKTNGKGTSETLMTIDDPDKPIRCEEWGRVERWSSAWSLRDVGQLVNHCRYGRNDVIPCTLFPFEPANRSYNKANAIWMAECSQLVYRKPAYVKATLLSSAWGFAGFDSVEWIDEPASDTQAFLAATQDYIILSFRGTKQPKDFLTDLKLARVPFLIDDKTENLGKVHRGFYEAFGSVKNQILEILNTWERDLPGRPIFVTGHSLGAALALLAAKYLHVKGKDVASVYVFGAPRVGDSKFQERYDAVLKDRTFLHINNTDIVTTIPLRWLGFRHVALPGKKFDTGHAFEDLFDDTQEPGETSAGEEERQAAHLLQIEKAVDAISESNAYLDIQDLRTDTAMRVSYSASFEKGRVTDHGVSQYLFKLACSIVDDRLGIL